MFFFKDFQAERQLLGLHCDHDNLPQVSAPNVRKNGRGLKGVSLSTILQDGHQDFILQMLPLPFFTFPPVSRQEHDIIFKMT